MRTGFPRPMGPTRSSPCPAPVEGEATAADRRAELKWSGKRDLEGGKQARHEQGVGAPFDELSSVGLTVHAARNRGEASGQTNLCVRPVVEVDGHEPGARFTTVRRADGVWIADRRRTGTSAGRCRKGSELPRLPSGPRTGRAGWGRPPCGVWSLCGHAGNRGRPCGLSLRKAGPARAAAEAGASAAISDRQSATS